MLVGIANGNANCIRRTRQLVAFASPDGVARTVCVAGGFVGATITQVRLTIVPSPDALVVATDPFDTPLHRRTVVIVLAVIDVWGTGSLWPTQAVTTDLILRAVIVAVASWLFGNTALVDAGLAIGTVVIVHAGLLAEPTHAVETDLTVVTVIITVATPGRVRGPRQTIVVQAALVGTTIVIVIAVASRQIIVDAAVVLAAQAGCTVIGVFTTISRPARLAAGVLKANPIVRTIPIAFTALIAPITAEVVDALLIRTTVPTINAASPTAINTVVCIVADLPRTTVLVPLALIASRYTAFVEAGLARITVTVIKASITAAGFTAPIVATDFAFRAPRQSLPTTSVIP